MHFIWLFIDKILARKDSLYHTCFDPTNTLYHDPMGYCSDPLPEGTSSYSFLHLALIRLDLKMNKKYSLAFASLGDKQGN